MAGRTPLPPKLLLLTGTKRGIRKAAAREAKAPPLIVGELVAPATLAADEAEHFRALASALAGEGRASPAHVQVVTLCARALAEVDRLELLVVAEGYRTDAGRQNPTVAARDAARSFAARSLTELGLSPISRSKAAAGPPEKPASAGGFEDIG